MPRPASVYPRIHVRRRGQWYALDIRHRGRRWWEATGTDRRAEADAAAERRRHELAGGAPGADSPENAQAHSLSEAAADFLAAGMGDIAAGTERMYRVKCRHVGRLLGGLDVAALTPEDVTRYIAVRREEGASSHTIAKELVALRRMLSHAERERRVGPGWRACVPARFKTGYAPRDRWLTEDEYLLLVDALPDARRIWLRAAVYLGGRESELRQIDWADVDLRLGFVAVRTAKIRKGQPVKVRHIPIADELRAALEAVPKAARKGPLLPCWCNGALMVARYGQKAGILKAPVYERVPSPRGTKRGRLLKHGECLSPNDLRRTFASWMLQRGAQVKEVADLLGHGSIAMVERIYGHLAAKNLVHAVARMPVFGKVARRRIQGAR